ncbi:hypothetical protein ACIRTB_31125 [Streptomyces sp. NPDC101158]|uniref:hypothetical protein n=1 Tax=Streptomyces sp. NPDC101158 TaxID=3366117 RepID=UPI0037F63515
MKKEAKDLAGQWGFCALLCLFSADNWYGRTLGDTVSVFAFGAYVAHALYLTIGFVIRRADTAMHRPDEVHDVTSHSRST